MYGLGVRGSMSKAINRVSIVISENILADRRGVGVLNVLRFLQLASSVDISNLELHQMSAGLLST